jgi:hypothetical protein
VIGWILMIGGIAIGAMVVLGLIGFVMTKLSQRAAHAPPPMQNIASAAPPQVVSSRPPPKTQALMPGAAVPAAPAAMPMTSGARPGDQRTARGS